ncbi:S9 family peptidase [Salinicoccus carnicancri]|uniref:S9 family peptidase n=1 Tax=Salinicoccus carnicancri TaxID=558170 RepID=UPI0002FB988F|nr:prolyl oligopeptidase family serine peptidase [Salinicoccus carnicancri]
MGYYIKYSAMKSGQNGERLFYISDESGKRELWQMNLVNGEVSQVTYEEENIKGYWLEEYGMVLAIDHNGNERNQLHRLEGDGALPFIQEPDYFHHYGIYDDTNEKFMVTRNHHSSSAFELCSYNTQGGIVVLEEFESPAYIKKKLDEDTLLVTLDVDNIDQEIYSYNIREGKLSKLPMPKGRFKSISLNSDDGFAYAVSDWGDGCLNLYRLNLTDWSYVKMTSFPWDIEHCKLSDDGKSAVIAVNENGCSTLYHYDLGNHEAQKMDFRADGVVHSLVWQDPDVLYLLFSSTDVPHCIYRLDMERKEQKIILQNYEDTEEVRWRMLSFTSFDGLKVPYFLYEPENGHGSAVIHVHGGPESQARPEFNELYYRLYKKGITVAVPNIRGSLGYGRFYLEADDREKRLDAMEDVVALRTHLIDRRGMNNKEISIMGRSYGGFMTLLLVTHHPGLWRRAVDIVGISDLTTFLNDTPAWRRGLRSEEYGFLGLDDKMFNEISPLMRAGNVEVPLMIFHSHHDSRVPFTESVQMADRMKNNGQDVTFTAYENEGHTFIRRKNLDDMNGKIISYLTE